MSESTRSHADKYLNVPSEALWGRVVELVCGVGDRQARILEQACCPDEAGKGEVAFWSRQLRAKKAAHQRAWDDPKRRRELFHTDHHALRGEDRLKESPASPRDIIQIRANQSEDCAIRLTCRFPAKQRAQLVPSRGIAHINNPAYTAVAQRENGLRTAVAGTGEERDRRHAREFANESREPAGPFPYSSRDRDHNGGDPALAKVPRELLDGVAVPCVIQSGSRRVDAWSFGGFEERRYGDRSCLCVVVGG